VKNVSLALLFLVALVATVGCIGLLSACGDVSRKLEVVEAKAATGPCGTEFVRLLSDGQAVVAGLIVPASGVKEYYFTPSPKGDEVWKKADSPPGHVDSAGRPLDQPTFIFRRCRCEDIGR